MFTVFSLVMPMDLDRLEQFTQTKKAYDAMPQKKEFIIPTRNHGKLMVYLMDHKLMKDVKLVSYRTENGFNCSKALNLGVRKAKYESIIITSPEVKPNPNVLDELEKLQGKNVICQVWDEDENHKVTMSLVHNGFRSDTPAMYFLAMFNKSDIETINGWDEEFMRGYAYEDTDFGERWNRAGLPFEVTENIQAVHQYHPRFETIPSGANTNFQIHNENNAKGVIKPLNGLKKL